MKRRTVRHDPIATMEQERGIIIKTSFKLKHLAAAKPVPVPVQVKQDEQGK